MPAAAEWGCRPWDLTGDPADAEDQKLWMLRWQGWREAVASAHRDRDRHDPPAAGPPGPGRG